MKGYFYIIVNKLNGQRYYGSGSKKNYFGSSKYLINSIKKYGIENFEKTILRWFETREEAFAFEDRFLKLYKISSLPNTYNLKDSGKGGDTISNNPNKEIIKMKMSLSAKASNYLRGKTYEQVHGEEKSSVVKDKLKNAHKGARQSEETKKKRSDSLKEDWADLSKKEERLKNCYFRLNNPSKRSDIRQKMSIERLGENNPNAKKIEIDGTVYLSIIDAVNKLGISRSTIQRNLKNNKNYKIID